MGKKKKKKGKGAKRKVALIGTKERKPTGSEPPAENLIEQLQPRPGEDLDIHQAVACTRVLCAILENSAKQDRINLNRYGGAAELFLLVDGSIYLGAAGSCANASIN